MIKSPIISIDLSKINIELPQDDGRKVKIWHTEVKDGQLNICISIEEEKNEIL